MAYDLKKSFVAGILYIAAAVLVGFVSEFIQFSRWFFVPYLLFVLISVILYALFIYGYVKIAEGTKVPLLKVSSWGFIVIAILGAATGATMAFAGLLAPSSRLVAQPISQAAGTALFVWIGISIFLAVAHSVFAILFGIGVDKVPVESTTKKTLRTLSILEGASVLSIVGLLIAPYFAFESYIFKLLFLRDTYKKEHAGKGLRDKLWLFIPLALYLIALAVLALFIFIMFSVILGIFSALGNA